MKKILIFPIIVLLLLYISFANEIDELNRCGIGQKTLETLLIQSEKRIEDNTENSMKNALGKLREYENQTLTNINQIADRYIIIIVGSIVGSIILIFGFMQYIRIKKEMFLFIELNKNIEELKKEIEKLKR